MFMHSKAIRFLASGCILSVPYAILIAVLYHDSNSFPLSSVLLALFLGLPWSAPIGIVSVILSGSIYPETSAFFSALVPGENEWNGVMGALLFTAFCSLHINGWWLMSR
jgi:hypothetical protein